MSERYGDEVEPDIEGEVEDDDYPWAMIPVWVTLSGISDLAFRLFGLIRAHANQGGRLPFPSHKRLAKILGYSEANTKPIRDAMQELRDVGCLTTRLAAFDGGSKMLYKTHLEPHARVLPFTGPRQTSDLTPAVLDEMAAARARRKRGVTRNPSGRAPGKINTGGGA